MNNYYDVRLKEARLETMSANSGFIFIKGNLADKNIINDIFGEYKPSVVVNLGVQDCVRYFITNPTCVY